MQLSHSPKTYYRKLVRIIDRTSGELQCSSIHVPGYGYQVLVSVRRTVDHGTGPALRWSCQVASGPNQSYYFLMGAQITLDDFPDFIALSLPTKGTIWACLLGVRPVAHRPLHIQYAVRLQ